MSLFDFLSNAINTVSNTGEVTIKTSRNTHTIAFTAVKGKTLREVLREVQEYLQINAEEINFAERTVTADLDSTVSTNTTYKVERVTLNSQVEEGTTYNVDVTRGSKG